MTRNAIIDRDAALNLIDELRVAVPEEVRAAKRINPEGERIIEKAQEEAERIVARAQEQAAYLIEERGLTEAAEDESRRIIADGRGRGGRRSATAPTSTPPACSAASRPTSRRTLQRHRARPRRCSTSAAPPTSQAQEPRRVDDEDDVDAPAAGYGDEELDAEEGASTAGRR